MELSGSLIGIYDNLGTSIKNLVLFFIQPNAAVIAAHILSSITVIIFTIYFFWKPTNKFILKQKARLDSAHDNLVQANREARYALTQLKEEKKKFQAFKSKFILEMKNNEKHFLSQKTLELEEIKASIISSAREKAKAIEEEAMKKVNEKIVILSVELAERLIKSSINKRTKSRIINSYIGEISDLFNSKKSKLGLN